MPEMVAHDEPVTRLVQENGRVFLSGSQAIIRLMLEQVRQDRERNLRVRGFVTGYPGSPLGGLEQALKHAQPLLAAHGIRHIPGQNEELAASALMGTQMLDEHPHPDCDGVVGYWYGKGPGVDRASDAFKHGNFGGTSKHGAVVILSGEDHEAKSSSVPYQQDFSFEHFGVPILQPASTAEILTLGAHAVALSRYSGCWVAMKLTAPVCDSGETIDLATITPDIHMPQFTTREGRAFEKDANFRFFPIVNVARELNLYDLRHSAVHAYAHANALDRMSLRNASDKIGIIASGKSFVDTMAALASLGLTETALGAAGIRTLKLGLVYPIEPDVVRTFAQDLDMILVVEEKRDFIEKQVARIICNLPKVPNLLGKRDLNDTPLFPVHGGMNSDLIARLLCRALKDHIPLPASAQVVVEHAKEIESHALVSWSKRTPNYCSGCPHNIGTKLADGQIAWGAPGCHVFAAIMPEPKRRIEAVTQYGGEGLPWIGLAPFTSRKHIVQNVGDGSLFHSSYLNIRFAVTTGVNLTFKILYNGAIANTGGQPPVGGKSIPELARLLLIEGVAKIVLLTRTPEAYRRQGLPHEVQICEDIHIEAALRDLEQIPGVTILIHDGQCANERRRKRKRALAAPTARFTIVNEEVCENCGDCSAVSNCMSLHKIETPFGRKTRIHQTSCNQDTSCIQGECPSFVTLEVKPGTKLKKPERPDIDASSLPPVMLPDVGASYRIYMPGVGGTGVITLNAVLAQAASLDGLRAISFDLTGAAQKWGPVVSSIVLTRDFDTQISNQIGVGQANLFLALDMLTATDQTHLSRCSPEKTAAVINETVLPTGEMVRNVDLVLPAHSIVQSIRSLVDAGRTFSLPAGDIAEHELGDYMLTNMVALGAAYQSGLVPISAASIEEAIRRNGSQIELNISAFRRGRLHNHKTARDPIKPVQLADRIEELASHRSDPRQHEVDRLMKPFARLDDSTRRTLAVRVEDLIDYQGVRYAGEYVRDVRLVLDQELSSGTPGTLPFTNAVVRNLHKLMAYKDEYEVARLLAQTTFRKRAKSLVDGDCKLVFHLQPPILRHFGAVRKIRLGEWFAMPLKALYHMRFLRGTALDIFGYAKARRMERALVPWYRQLVQKAIAHLNADNLATALELANLPDDIRGYEDLKLSSATKAQEKAATLLVRLTESKTSHQHAA